MQRYHLFADAPRIFHQLQFINQLISFVLPLAAKGIRIRPLLNFASRERIGHVSGAGRDFRLMNLRPFRRKEPLLFSPEIHIRFRERDPFDRTQLGINFHQQPKILFNGNTERINLERGRPLGLDGFLRDQTDIGLLDLR